MSNVLIGEIGVGSILNVPELIFPCKPQNMVTFRTHAVVTSIGFEAMNKIIIKYQGSKQKLENFVILNPFNYERDYFIDIAQRSIDFLKRVDQIGMRKIYMACNHLYLTDNEVIFNVGDICESIYIVVSGNIEIGLSNGTEYMTMDFLGKGSVLGFNGVILDAEQLYIAKVRSPRANLIEIPKSVILS